MPNSSIPTVVYNKEFMTPYDVTKLAGRPESGKAAIEAFFTAKGADVYAILPRWPGEHFTIKEFGASHLKSVALLGTTAPLRWKETAGSVSIELPDMPEELRSQPAWVLKLSQ